MIGLDTNVLVRAITADDAGQQKRVIAFLQKQCTQARPGFVNLIVLCELAWTLDKAYGYSRAEIAKAIEVLLTTAELSVERRDDVAAALAVFHRTSVGFADILIDIVNRSHGCEATFTFDRKAVKLDGFKSMP